jgi:hypothetical protein
LRVPGVDLLHRQLVPLVRQRYHGVHIAATAGRVGGAGGATRHTASCVQAKWARHTYIGTRRVLRGRLLCHDTTLTSGRCQHRGTGQRRLRAQSAASQWIHCAALHAATPQPHNTLMRTTHLASSAQPLAVQPCASLLHFCCCKADCTRACRRSLWDSTDTQPRAQRTRTRQSMRGGPQELLPDTHASCRTCDRWRIDAGAQRHGPLTRFSHGKRMYVLRHLGGWANGGRRRAGSRVPHLFGTFSVHTAHVHATVELRNSV